MSLTIPNRDLTAGIAGSWSDSIDPNADPLVTGDFPPVVTTDELVGASASLEARLVVGRVGNVPTGKLTAAVRGSVDPDDDVQAIGILVYAVETDVDDTTAHAGVYRQGVFNPTQLVFDDSFTTDAQKRLAFEGAPSPTAIVIRAPRTLTV